MKMFVQILISIIVYIAFFAIAMAFNFSIVWSFWAGWIANCVYEIIILLVKNAYKKEV